MTDQNRGAYTPQSEAPLAFDARSARGPGDRPMPITLLVSAGVFVLLVVALAFFFMKGMGEEPLRDAAIVGEPIEAIKAPPVDAAPQTNGLQVYTDDGSRGAPAFTSGPEAPAARPTTPVISTPLPPPPPLPPAPVVAAAPKAVPAPAPKVGETKAAPVVVATAPPVKATATGGGFVVQIGAFSSSALADKGYADAGKMLPGQMGGKSKRVETVARDTGALYRTSIAGFASRAEADAFCGALKAKGGNCLVRQ